MYVITANSVTEALYGGLDLLRCGGHRRDSRNGPVWKMDAPVTTCYVNPHHRVMTWPARDANPFFHLFESLWMLAGRNDVEPLRWYVRRMEEFSDDGETFHGAYGHRWRHAFDFDQLEVIIRNLEDNPDDRRCVLGMFDPRIDLRPEMDMATGGRVVKRDIPCNLVVKFSRGPSGRLNMTVFCRSNDIVWGAYGANAVHFSILQEYVAAGIGCEVGRYWQVSDDWHGYDKVVEPLFSRSSEAPQHDLYEETATRQWRPLVSSFEDWNADLLEFMEGATAPEDDVMLHTYRDPFFSEVAAPMHAAYGMHKERMYALADRLMDEVRAPDWQRAGREWLARRRQRWESRH